MKNKNKYSLLSIFLDKNFWFFFLVLTSFHFIVYTFNPDILTYLIGLKLNIINNKTYFSNFLSYFIMNNSLFIIYYLLFIIINTLMNVKNNIFKNLKNLIIIFIVIILYSFLDYTIFKSGNLTYLFINSIIIKTLIIIFILQVIIFSSNNCNSFVKILKDKNIYLLVLVLFLMHLTFYSVGYPIISILGVEKSLFIVIAESFLTILFIYLLIHLSRRY